MIEPATDVSTAQIVAPKSDTAARLTRIWQEMLDVESISPDQNYFDLGGDSILAVQLFIQIEQEFKVKLPLATLFDAPTIRELAEVLQPEVSSADWSPLVPIQPDGTRPPFFCIHPHGGNVLIYRDLSRHLGSDQPFYGLQCRGLDGAQPPLTRIEDMAALYINEIRKTQRHGPYFLGGYCMGGAVAFEVAQQLRSHGEQVALLALFDTMNWTGVSVPSIWLKSYHLGQRLTFHVTNFLSLDSDGKAAFFREKAKTAWRRVRVWRSILRAKFVEPLPAAESDTWILGQIWRANIRAYMNYAPQSYSGAVTDFRPAKQYRGWEGPELKWEGLAQGGEEIMVLPVNPPGMMAEPNVKHLAAALTKFIDVAIRNCQVC